MNVLITGTSSGIGNATAIKFLDNGYTVLGIDRLSMPSNLNKYDKYTHYTYDISKDLPDIKVPIHILINNAGTQQENDIEVNLVSAIKISEKYAITPSIKSILNVCSTSAHNGAEFPEYCASKGGLLAYSKHLAMKVAQYGATCNSISPGGVITPMNSHILKDDKLYQTVLNETLLGKWASADEIAEWIYFLTVINKSMTGQDIIIDNGELCKYNFIW